MVHSSGIGAVRVFLLALAISICAGGMAAAQTPPVSTGSQSQKPDSILDGLVKGAIIGGLAGGVPAVLYVKNECCWPNGSAAFVIKYAALGAGIGSGAGALIDFLHRGRRSAAKAGPPSLSVGPIVLPGKAAVTGAVRW